MYAAHLEDVYFLLVDKHVVIDYNRGDQSVALQRFSAAPVSNFFMHN